MYEYSTKSKERLNSAHPKLQMLFISLALDYNISILEGYRPEDKQNLYFDTGRSKVRYPDGKHNSQPSLAIDACLYPIDWDDVGRNYMFAGIVLERAKTLGIDIRAGADWDGDLSTKDQSFHDLVHFELTTPN
jgi:peptidoglycan L-alanyl-D-glutamate endopeptidase CwlK